MHALGSPIAILRRFAAFFGTPAWAVLGLYALARLVSLDLWLGAVRQVHGARVMAGGPFRLWTPALLRWDAVYYASIAQSGYPATVPTTPDGQVIANTWAFFPAFPATAAALARLTGLTFVWSAMTINVLAGALVAVLLAAIVRSFADDRTALRAAAIWAFLPTAFLLHVGYSEAMYLAFASGCLLAIARGRTVVAALLLVGAGLCRGATPPLAAALATRVLLDLHASRPDRTSAVARPATAWWSSAGVLVIAAVAPWLWMFIAWRMTGRLDAVAASQGAWGIRVDPVTWTRAWLTALSHDGTSLLMNPSVIVLGVVAALSVACLRESRLSPVLKVYTLVSAALLAALAQPGAVAFGSVPRFAFAILTLPAIAALWIRRGWTVALVIVGSTGLQYLWVLNVWSGRIGVAP